MKTAMPAKRKKKVRTMCMTMSRRRMERMRAPPLGFSAGERAEEVVCRWVWGDMDSLKSCSLGMSRRERETALWEKEEAMGVQVGSFGFCRLLGLWFVRRLGSGGI